MLFLSPNLLLFAEKEGGVLGLFLKNNNTIKLEEANTAYQKKD